LKNSADSRIKKVFTMKKITALILFSTLFACDGVVDGNSGPCGGVAGCPPDIEVIAIDENGEFVAADDVYWYFAPDSSEYDGEHALTCETGDCMSWAIQTAPGAFFYVAGNREGPAHNDPYCGYSG
jgi:hypothetical protein